MRGRIRIKGHAANDHRTDRVQSVLEGRDDAKIAAAASERPEQVAIVIDAGSNQPAVGEHDVCAEQIVDRHAERPPEPTKATTERESSNSCIATVPPVVASPCAWVAASNSVHFTPGSARAVRVAASTVMAFIEEKSMTRPSSQVPVPATPWAPPRMASGKRCSRAKLTAACTS